eukprot:TRINITY_DN8982_c0_g2_i3.p1 TRINITY_DN8982_c0_g2~~TRINITY_DN8982_c0_g2_i3.p1  ORF type:complete len:1276 (-),score=184.86 TRINITY_DN8982_c0_g2_i3:414-3794(-)
MYNKQLNEVADQMVDLRDTRSFRKGAGQGKDDWVPQQFQDSDDDDIFGNDNDEYDERDTLRKDADWAKRQLGIQGGNKRGQNPRQKFNQNDKFSKFQKDNKNPKYQRGNNNFRDNSPQQRRGQSQSSLQKYDNRDTNNFRPKSNNYKNNKYDKNDNRGFNNREAQPYAKRSPNARIKFRQDDQNGNKDAKYERGQKQDRYPPWKSRRNNNTYDEQYSESTRPSEQLQSTLQNGDELDANPLEMKEEQFDIVDENFDPKDWRKLGNFNFANRTSLNAYQVPSQEDEKDGEDVDIDLQLDSDNDEEEDDTLIQSLKQDIKSRRKQQKRKDDDYYMDLGGPMGEQFLDLEFLDEQIENETSDKEDGEANSQVENGSVPKLWQMPKNGKPTQTQMYKNGAYKLDSHFIRERDLRNERRGGDFAGAEDEDEEGDEREGIGQWADQLLQEVEKKNIDEDILESNWKLMKDWADDDEKEQEESESEEDELDQYEDMQEEDQELEDLQGYYEWVQNVRYPIRKLRYVPSPPDIQFNRPKLRPWFKWGKIDWDKVEKEVYEMQRDIYLYTRYSDQVMHDRQTVHELQKQLINSYAAKLLAIRIATSDIKRIKRPGVDLLEIVKPNERMEMAEDISVDGKAQKVRRHEKNLVLTYEDEAKQLLVRMALEPEWEARFEPNNFGFRPGRSKYDCILSTMMHVRKDGQYKYYINARVDFRALDIEHLMYKLDTLPEIEQQIRAWFQKAAIVVPDNMTDYNFRETEFDYHLIGTLMVNIALHGVEWEVKKYGYDLPEAPGLGDTRAERAKQINLIRWGNEFVVVHHKRELLLEVYNLLQRWLQQRGLTFDEHYTHVGNAGMRAIWNRRHVPAGMTFVNFSLVQSRRQIKKEERTDQRDCELRVLIRPSRAVVQQHLDEMSRVVKFHYATKAEDLVHALNPRIQEWQKEFSISSLRMPFSYMDFMLYQKIRRWGYRRHNNKGKKWVRAKYFKVINERRRMFGDDGSYQVLYRELQLTRHPRLRHTKSVYDLEWGYWNARLNSHPDVGYQKYEMLKRQGGKCAYCMRTFNIFDIKNMHLRLLVPREEGGTSYDLSNLQLIHRHCQYHVLQEMGWERVEYLKDLRKKMEQKRWKRRKRKPIIV